MKHILKHAQPQQIAVLCRPAPYLETLAHGATLVNRQTNYDITAKACIYGGGTQFYSFRKAYTKRALAAFALRNPAYALRKLTGRVHQAINPDHTAMLGIGFGPFEEETAGVQRLRSKLKQCDFIYVRDAWSYRFCQSHGLEHARLACDLAFTSPLRQQLDTARRDVRTRDDAVAFIVRDWPYGKAQENYLEQVQKAARELKQRGMEIDLVVFSSDLSLDRGALADLGRLVQWDPETMTDVEFIAALSQYKVIVAARFHGAVFAYLLNRPVIGINIDPKIGLFFEQIEMPQFVWSSPYRLDHLLAMIDAIVDTWPAESVTDRRRAKLTDNADAMLSEFDGYLSDCLGGRGFCRAGDGR
jgi:polysaccharide pyruvyl transferase WcaK-like protein